MYLLVHQLMDPDTLSAGHSLEFFFIYKLRHTDDDCQWLLLIEGGAEKSDMITSSYLFTEELMGVLSHLIVISSNMSLKWICTK